MEFVKNQIKKVLNTGVPIDANNIIERIKNYEVVSFDIFDTLLKRNVVNPCDVFAIIEKKIDIKNFCLKRKKAEILARKKAKEKEVVLVEIYNQLFDLNEIQKKQCIDIEYEIEKELLTLNRDIFIIYNWCLENQKKIILTSDTYFQQNFIENILKKNKIIGYQKIYLSSAYRRVKSDGSLFFVLLNENNLDSKEVIHIGDSKKGDYIEPKKLGINSIQIPRYYKKALYTYKFCNRQKQNYFNCFINNTEPYHLDNYQKFGYECFGPFLWGYVNWMYKSIKEKGINKIYFFSRDGLIIKKAFDICFSNMDINTYYLEVSRRSLRVPILWMDNKFDTVLDMISPSKLISLNMIFDGVGLNIDNYLELISQYGMHKFDVFDRSNIKKNIKLMNLYKQLIPDIIKNSKKEYKALVKYIEQNNLKGKFAVVDIGWSGSMQRYLEQVLSKINIEKEIYGFYVGIATHCNRNLNVLPDIRLNGYLFDYKNDNNAKDIRSGFVGLFETLFLEQDGSVKNYYENDSIVKAMRYDYEYIVNNKPTIEYFKVKSIQQYALEFVKNICSNSILNKYEYTPKELFAGIYDVGAKPNNKDIDMFANFNFYDEGETLKLAHPKPLYYYFLHFSELKKDFLKSRWKIGFLKKMFKIKLPYEKIYETMLRFK